MKLIHTSPSKIERIDSFGIAGECLFFSHKEYVMTAQSDYIVYELEIDEDQIIAVSQLHNEEIIAEIAEEFNCSSNDAEALLDGSGCLIKLFEQAHHYLQSEWSHERDAEKSWWLQGKRGECAKLMGFEACEDTDEQGTVYIVPMLNRENDLKIKN